VVPACLPVSPLLHVETLLLADDGTKLKLVKRQGYGRTKVDLLRKRLLRSA
jgi:hypothetical protein